ncbi:uncharacterized protein CELE_F46C5.4 [Caenorhabditis elegans]|uniref:Uncharacterized protein F46C5.4 n=1 Tax=Caenorhabditis elegans TaxID=6239 RepID=YAF4_CAEEL|nr:Uncharacterized protein CELE_F46C5.4 [Caenorhabditis elegans]P52882.2 RecName: Full=Uncharacterized protein F46C5.4; Flags: Precursor [Caenorhabditis elegans]CAA91046.2 Uncharacterized protein CELE_F46C5.4 [Caenorhabditis elegans]|eukprot:NP_495882.2 Uncharacterized protein CELE_F46C5.4 [Caenorhabditis elegans]
MRLHRTNNSRRCTILLILALKIFDFVDTLACYSCIALNYRQNVLSRNDALSPPQNRENLTALFDVLSKNNISHVEVSSSCADVTLTTQPSFLNTPIAICDMNDKCVKMDFYYSGEKVVLRNCLSNLMETVNSPKLKKYCPMYSDDRSEIKVGPMSNVSVCSCQSDLCNSSEKSSVMIYFSIAFILVL